MYIIGMEKGILNNQNERGGKMVTTIKTATPKEAKLLMEIVMIMRDAIKDASAEKEGGIPSGHLYAMMMTLPGITLQVYQYLEGVLIESGKVTKKNDFLSWVNN
jgi:hypothetical protein